MDEFVTLDSDSASDIFPNLILDLFPRLLEESNLICLSWMVMNIWWQDWVSSNRPVSYSNGWTGSSMKWRLMRAN